MDRRRAGLKYTLASGVTVLSAGATWAAFRTHQVGVQVQPQNQLSRSEVRQVAIIALLLSTAIWTCAVL